MMTLMFYWIMSLVFLKVALRYGWPQRLGMWFAHKVYCRAGDARRKLVSKESEEAREAG